MRFARFFIALVAAALLAGCAGEPNEATGAPGAASPASPTSPTLEVHEARAQLMPDVGAVYLKLVNSGQAADRLVAIETDAASSAETHETVVEDGVMRMVPRPEGFEIPAGGSVELVPGGKHIMLLEPRPPRDEAEASTLSLTLRFATSEPIVIEAPVAAMPGSGSEHAGHGSAHDSHGSDPGSHGSDPGSHGMEEG